jgi:hypothetical protein
VRPSGARCLRTRMGWSQLKLLGMRCELGTCHLAQPTEERNGVVGQGRLARRRWQVRHAVTGGLASGWARPLCRVGDALEIPWAGRLGQWMGVA